MVVTEVGECLLSVKVEADSTFSVFYCGAIILGIRDEHFQTSSQCLNC